MQRPNKKIKLNTGMTYVELIVVLSIFSVLSSVAIFSYGDFQAKVDIKNLASDVALKAVEAQKSSLSGLVPPSAQQSQVGPTWKPSYGVYFNITSGRFNLSGVTNTSFVYFVDLNQNGNFDFSSCPGSGECLDKITITKGNIISNLDVFYQDSTSASITDLAITFSRPNSGAVIQSSTSLRSNISYAQVTILSPKGSTGLIKLYPSGRIQVN